VLLHFLLQQSVDLSQPLSSARHAAHVPALQGPEQHSLSEQVAPSLLHGFLHLRSEPLPLQVRPLQHDESEHERPSVSQPPPSPLLPLLPLLPLVEPSLPLLVASEDDASPPGVAVGAIPRVASSSEGASTEQLTINMPAAQSTSIIGRLSIHKD